jgi:hypothetical protein
MDITITVSEEVARNAEALGVDLVAAAAEGVRDAVVAAMGQSDRQAYVQHPEDTSNIWTAVESWCG